MKCSGSSRGRSRRRAPTTNRESHGREIDILLEAADGRVAAIEVKAAHDAGDQAIRHIASVRDQLGDRFTNGGRLPRRARVDSRRSDHRAAAVGRVARSRHGLTTSKVQLLSARGECRRPVMTERVLASNA